MRRRGVRVALAVALASAAAPAVAAPAGPGCDPALPVVAHRAGAVVAGGAQGSVACGVATGFPTSETAVAVTGDGTLLFTPAQTENSSARSTDAGATWQLTYPAQEQYTSLWNTVDPHLVVDWRTGRAFLVHATGPTRTLPILVDESPLPSGVPTVIAAAYGFQVYGSADDGRTWRTADEQTQPIGDWEKLAVGPPPPGAARPVGYPDVVYVCGNSPFEVSGPGRGCFRSLDGGASFVFAGFVTPSPNMPTDVCPPLAANAGAVDGAGLLYQPVSCAQGAYVAVSDDEGASFAFHRVPGAPASNGLSGSLQIVVGHDDTLFATWVADDRIVLARSRDQARTWSAPVTISAPGLHTITRPAPAAGAAGHMGVAYYAATDPKATKLTLYLTQTDDALDAQPLFTTAALNDPAHPIYADQDLTGASPRADYIGASYDVAGTTLWAGAVEQFGDPDPSGHIATTGYVGRVVRATAVAPCTTPKRLTVPVGRVRGHRVVRVLVRIGGRVVLRRRGTDIRRVVVLRPSQRPLTVTIVAVDHAGRRVVTRHRYAGCVRVTGP